MDHETQLWNRLDTGRHAIDEDALLTPIFAALARGGWRQRESIEAERFRRNPLTAPLPTAPLPTVPLRSAPLPSGPVPSGTQPAGPRPAGLRPVALVPSQEGGRHHLRRSRAVPGYATA